MNMHRPIYTSSTAGVAPPSVLRVAEDLQQALEPVFALYQVRSLASQNLYAMKTQLLHAVACL